MVLNPTRSIKSKNIAALEATNSRGGQAMRSAAGISVPDINIDGVQANVDAETTTIGHLFTSIVGAVHKPLESSASSKLIDDEHRIVFESKLCKWKNVDRIHKSMKTLSGSSKISSVHMSCTNKNSI